MGIKYSVPKINPRAFADRVNIEMATIMNLEVTHIKLRTSQSRDADGAAFVPYSPAYARYRVEKSRDTTPNLLFTGSMLRAMSSNSSRSGNIYSGTIFFAIAAESAKARGNNLKRNFFAFDRVQVERITQKIRSLFGIT